MRSASLHHRATRPAPAAASAANAEVLVPAAAEARFGGICFLRAAAARGDLRRLFLSTSSSAPLRQATLSHRNHYSRLSKREPFRLGNNKLRLVVVRKKSFRHSTTALRSPDNRRRRYFTNSGFFAPARSGVSIVTAAPLRTWNSFRCGRCVESARIQRSIDRSFPVLNARGGASSLMIQVRGRQEQHVFFRGFEHSSDGFSTLTRDQIARSQRHGTNVKSGASTEGRPPAFQGVLRAVRHAVFVQQRAGFFSASANSSSIARLPATCARRRSKYCCRTI